MKWRATDLIMLVATIIIAPHLPKEFAETALKFLMVLYIIGICVQSSQKSNV